MKTRAILLAALLAAATPGARTAAASQAEPATAAAAVSLFYHDTGGVTWSRQDMLASTEKHVCGNFRRELVPGSLKVFPIKEFGAIAQGSHRFCRFDGEKCEGIADFVIVWSQQGDRWQITRVLSYGHRAND